MKDEPAFPGIYGVDKKTGKVRFGLTKREYFAGLVMQGMMAHPRRPMAIDIEVDYFATHAVRMADALIKELERNKGN